MKFLRARGETDIIFPSEGKVSSSSLDERTTLRNQFARQTTVGRPPDVWRTSLDERTIF